MVLAGALGQYSSSPTTKARTESALKGKGINVLEGLTSKHSLTSIDPIAELLPAGQSAHVFVFDVSDEIAPDSAYVPTGQETGPEQEVLPRRVDAPKVPAGQFRHPLAAPGKE